MNTQTQALEKGREIFHLSNLPKICGLLLAFMIPISTTLSSLMLCCLLFSWVMTGNIKSTMHIMLDNPLGKVSIFLFGLFVFGALYSDAPWQDIHDALRRMAKLLFIPFLMPVFVEAKWRRCALGAFVFAMIFTLLLSYLKVYGGLSIITRHTEACVFKNHIETNLMMGLAAFILGHFALASRSWPRYILFGIMLAMTFYVLGMSEGRSGYLVFIGLWMLFLFQRFSFKFIICGVLVLASVLGTVTLKSEYFQNRMTQLYHGILQYADQDKTAGVNSLAERLEYLKESLTLFRVHPWLGSGTGGFKTAYQEHALKNHLPPTRNPHNEYLNIAVQLGSLGLLGLCAMFCCILKTSFQLQALERYVTQGLLLALIIGCLGNSWLMDFTPGYLFVVLLGICLSGYSVRKTYA